MLRVVSLFAVVVVGVVVAAEPAGAKVLPSDLAVVGRPHRAGAPVAVVFHPHPQNVLSQSFDWEVGWAKVRAGQTVAKAARKPGRAVLMEQVAPDEYRGTFTPRAAGLYLVHGRSGNNPTVDGYPKPIRVRVKR